MLHFSRVGAAIVAIACLGFSGCGGGGSSSATGPASASLCADRQQGTAGAYVVDNNTWNKGTVTGYRQCIGIANATSGNDAIDAVWEWSWPQPATGVRSFPEIIYGRKPWNNTTTDKLPRVVDQLGTVRAELSFASTHDGVGNLAFDVWLTASNVMVGDHLPLKHEVMIWLESFGMGPAGGLVDTATIDGVTWDLYATTATWGPEPFQYLAYVPRGNLSSPSSINIRKFLDHLRARGSITGQEWLASVEFGNELMAGTGRTTISGFKVSVD